MRFTVEEWLVGRSGNEISIETGNGGGDCGTPLPEGQRFLVFASREKDGKLWTGMCSGNRLLGDSAASALVEEYRKLVRTRSSSIFGHIVQSKPVWKDDDVQDSGATPVAGMKVKAANNGSSAETTTSSDGAYEFKNLVPGSYRVAPDIGGGLDFDHEYEDRYQADLKAGQCANIGFMLEPITRIRGRVNFPAPYKSRTIEVVAIPTRLRELNQFSGKWDFTDENDRFDLWPLPAGDYYVGVNINSTPKADAPFPPTYYPGVTDKRKASVVHIAEGEIKELELQLPELAASREVRFTATGLDGKPLRKIYVQFEDLRHPGDAASYVNVDLDSSGAGTLQVFSGYNYHLHASHWISHGVVWCAKPVVIPAGSGPLQVQFVMNRKSGNCDLQEIDGLRK